MNKWIDQKVTVVKAKASSYLIHIKADLTNNRKVVWFEVAHIRWAPWASVSYSTPQHGGLPHDDATTPGQVGPWLDRGLLEACIYDPAIHQLWMCYCIYTCLPLNMQQLDKALLLMFLAKICDLVLHDACSVAAGGWFSKAVVKLYRHVGMNPRVQLVMDLDNMSMDYTGLDALVLQLPKQQLTLGKAMHEQRLVWEALCVLNEAQHR